MKNHNGLNKKFLLLLIVCTTMHVAMAICAMLMCGGIWSIVLASVVAFSFILHFVSLWVSTKSLFNPIGRITGLTELLAEGDLAKAKKSIDNSPRDDELGNIYRNLSILVSALLNFVTSMQSISKKDLTLKTLSNTENDLITNELRKMIYAQNETIYCISVAAENIANGSKTMFNSGSSLAKSASEQSGTIEEITATVTEIAIQSKQISETAQNAKQLSDNINDFTGIGGAHMDKMLQAMTQIKDATKAINRIIKVIDEIAFQTNILAINASVEAARSGRDGKGFAVVAHEVRNLAARSAKAAKETDQLIAETIASVNTGSSVASETADALAKIHEAVHKSSPLIDSISVATNEQYIGIEQVNQSIEQAARTTERFTFFAEESAIASEQLSAQAELLRDMVDEYQLDNSIVFEKVPTQKHNDLKISLD